MPAMALGFLNRCPDLDAVKDGEDDGTIGAQNSLLLFIEDQSCLCKAFRHLGRPLNAILRYKNNDACWADLQCKSPIQTLLCKCSQLVNLPSSWVWWLLLKKGPLGL